MDYNINFQVAALIIVALLLHYFLTQKKLHNANAKIFTYVLILAGLYILLDRINTLIIINYTPERANGIMLALTGIYLFDVMLPFVLYCCTSMICSENGEKITGFSAAYAAVTVVMLFLTLTNLKTGWFFSFNESDKFVTGKGYVFLYIYALAYALAVIWITLKNCNNRGSEKLGILSEFLVIEGICMVIQMYTQRLLLTSFGLALGLVFLYLTMNNPGDYIDSTTGVFDKQYFDNWIGEKLKKKTEFHLLAVEAYMLKQVNKVYGSSVGDQLLAQIAKELQSITDSVEIFRITGNCFLMVTDSLAEYEKNKKEMEQIFRKPFVVNGETIDFPAIICGILNGEKMEQKDVLLAYIDYLASLVKHTDETVVIQSDERILEGFRYEKEVEKFLKTAVDEDLFEVYYQPVYWLKEDRYITLEALSRLRHPSMGMIPPDVFIGIAEKQGMISAVGCLQLHKVCRFIKEHEYIMKKIRNVKFNLSPSELMKPGYSHVLIGIIQGYGLDPGYFQFEITENVATEYSESFCTAIDDFAEVGIHMCLDDFGSGYANLNAVLRIPFSAVKMDRSLLSGVSSDPQTATFYRSIVMILQHMGYKVIAEGAETEKEVKLLEKWGVDMIQGYYFSRPLCEEKLLEKIS